jgi:hypothetical protein
VFVRKCVIAVGSENLRVVVDIALKCINARLGLRQPRRKLQHSFVRTPTIHTAIKPEIGGGNAAVLRELLRKGLREASYCGIYEALGLISTEHAREGELSCVRGRVPNEEALVDAAGAAEGFVEGLGCVDVRSNGLAHTRLARTRVPIEQIPTPMRRRNTMIVILAARIKVRLGILLDLALQRRLEIDGI